MFKIYKNYISKLSTFSHQDKFPFIPFSQGTRIISDPKFFITYKNEMVVSEMEAEDVGMYECRAANQAGTVSDFANVQMAGQLLLISKGKLLKKDRVFC
jgi:hypothetical protein